MEKETPDLKFYHFEELILQKLAKGKKLVLYGNPSDELGDNLTEFILNRFKDEKAKGQKFRRRSN